MIILFIFLLRSLIHYLLSLNSTLRVYLQNDDLSCVSNCHFILFPGKFLNFLFIIFLYTIDYDFFNPLTMSYCCVHLFSRIWNFLYLKSASLFRIYFQNNLVSCISTFHCISSLFAICSTYYLLYMIIYGFYILLQICSCCVNIFSEIRNFSTQILVFLPEIGILFVEISFPGSFSWTFPFIWRHEILFILFINFLIFYRLFLNSHFHYYL